MTNKSTVRNKPLKGDSRWVSHNAAEMKGRVNVPLIVVEGSDIRL